MKLGEPIFFEPNTYHNSSSVELYHELVNRHDNLRHALGLYRILEESRGSDDSKTHNSVMRLRESLLWYLTVEYYSRFLSDSSRRADSKRCIDKLIKKINNNDVNKMHAEFLEREKELIGYVKVQRMKYFAHADNADWDFFPRVFGQDYKVLLDDIADILDVIKGIISTKRIAAREPHIKNIFNI